ncbi:hypothetical protein FACS18947_5650 [Bacteroidia bacterium]|nr:hypothetical protein FACS18947_5650 [Bacteroidia bacterium]
MKKLFVSMMVIMMFSICVMAAGCGAAEPSPTTPEATESENKKEDKKLVIGVSMFGTANEGGMALADACYVVAEELGVEVKMLDANYDTNVQNANLETLITNQVDGILLMPVDATGLSAGVDSVLAADIPIVGVNATLKEEDQAKLTSFSGSDDVMGGELIANRVIGEIGGKGKVVHFQGIMGMSGQLNRSQGIEQVLSQNPDVELLAQKTANWSRAEAMTIMENWIQSFGSDINGVIAENDEMALGALQALEQAGKSDVVVVGLDGLVDAFISIDAGKQNGTFIQDFENQVREGMTALVKYLNGEDIETYYDVPFIEVTKDNVKQYIK